MATVVETLILKIDGDLNSLRSELQKSGAVVQQSSSKMARSAGTAQRAFVGLGRSAVNLASKLAVAAAAFLTVRKIVVAFSEVDALAKTADRLGLTTEALSGLQLAASQTGVESRTLETSLQRLNRRLSEVAETGGGVAKKGLDALGLTAEQLLKLPLEGQFGLIGDRLNTISGQAQKTAIAFGFFDTEGGKLLNTLALGTEGLKGFEKEAVALGFAITRVDAAKIEAANDAFDKLGKFITGQARLIATELAPALEAITLSFLQSAKEGTNLGDVAGGVAKLIIGGFGIAKLAVAGLRVGVNLAIVAFGELGGLAIQGADLIVRGFALAKAVVLQFGSIAVDVADEFVQAFQGIADQASATWDFIKAGADVVASGIFFVFDRAKKAVVSIVQGIRLAFAEALDVAALAVAASEGFVNVQAGLSEKLANTGGAIQAAIIKERAASKNAIDTAKETLDDSTEALKTAFEKLVAPTETPGSAILQETAKGLNELALAQLEVAENGNETTESLRENLEAIRLFTAKANERLAAAVEEGGALGGVGGIADQIRQFETIRDLREKEFELEAVQRKEQKEVLLEIEREAAEADRALRENALGQIFSLDQSHIDATRELWNSGLEGRAQLLGTFFKNISALQNSENRKLFEIGKAAAIAEAGVNTFLAATKAYQALAGIPVVGPGLGAAAAAAAIVAGKANIDRIRNQQFGGGSAGGGGGGGSVAAPATSGGGGGGGGEATPLQTQNVNISLIGERFDQNQVRALIESINEATSDNNRLQVN